MPAPNPSKETKKPGAIPDSLVQLLLAADAKNGLPAGTMKALMQQEIGGNFDKFLSDPTTYHYPLNAMGKRVAAHTGKESSAFGPFGILDSTALKPGYGVAPMKDKSLEEQVRFAAEYLAARSSRAGSLSAGLAGYGEGSKYSDQVVARIPGQAPQGVTRLAMSSPPSQPPQMAMLPIPEVKIEPGKAPAQVAQVQVQPQVQPETRMAAAGPVPLPDELVAYLASRGVKADPQKQATPESNAWQAFLATMQGRQGVGSEGVAQAPAIKPQDLDYGQGGQAYRSPGYARSEPVQVDFSAFTGFGGWGVRKQQGRTA